MPIVLVSGDLCAYVKSRFEGSVINYVIFLGSAPAEQLFAFFMLCAVYYVGNNGAGCGQFTCASAVKYNVAYRVAANENGVEYIAYRGELAVIFNYARANHGGNFAAVFASCLAEELNNAAEIVDIGDILQGYF